MPRPSPPSPPLHLLLAAPRGFCAGVDRAIQMVERALAKFGAPVFVRHQIVHNRHVVERLQGLGAVFVKELDEIPHGTTQPVLFSAHGVAKSVVERAKHLNLFALDATCPLVTKVHRQVDLYHRMGLQIIMIGHAGHAEVVGTMGQLPPGDVVLVENVADVATVQVRDPNNLAFVTQTTLSVDDTAAIIAALQARFPAITAPKKEDICYATTNRQAAVKLMAQRADLFLVVGGAASSNANRLVDTAIQNGARNAQLIDDAAAIDWDWFNDVAVVAVTSGASTPDDLVQDVITAIGTRYSVTTENVVAATEDAVFNLPRILVTP